jgi:hypothetical protein
MTLDEIMKVNPISYARDRLGFDCNNKGLARLPFCLSCIFADLILDNSDLQMILSERPMKEKGVIGLTDGLTCVAEGDSLFAAWAQRCFDNLDASTPCGYAKARRSTVVRTGQVLILYDRPRGSSLDDKRFGMFKNFWRAIREWFVGAGHRGQGVARSVSGYDGRRLSAPLTIRRDCRKSKVGQPADSQSGDDDD